jgi:prolyl-tRNA editing enzyme YbaK/EbsC (Cys-tRNA(Pro) deacylase)
MIDVALASDSAPHAPAIILQLLDKLGVRAAAVADQASLDPAKRIQSALLEDAIGAMLVLFTQDQLLDLNHLAELTGRQLVAVKPERLQRMLDKHQLGCMPGLPPLTS